MIVQENAAWVEQQFSDCDLGDTRRTERLQKVAAVMLARPEASLPAQNAEWKDLKAAYRLFDRPEVTQAAVCQPHWEQTRRTQPGRYLLISDTTDIDLYSHPATTGLGMLGDGTGRGMQLHHCLVYDCDRRKIVGQAGGMLFYRKPQPKKESRAARMERTREGVYWGQVVDQVGSPPPQCQWIHVFDRGGDNFESLCHLKLSGCDWIVRAAQLHRNVRNAEGEQTTLKEVVETAKFLGSYCLHLRARPKQPARDAQMRVSVASVTFIPPAFKSPYVRQCGVDAIEMRVVVVQEVNAPPGVTPIRWVLLTSLPVASFADAWNVIEYYEHRWLIEEYHTVIKSGCSIEERALRTAARLEPLIGLTCVIGVRLFQLKLLGRDEQHTPAKGHVPSTWLKYLQVIKPTLQVEKLTVYAFFREIAKLGGFLARKGDGEPGWKTIWRGYRELQSTIDAAKLLSRKKAH